ncbi:ABC transporter permease [Bacillus sp. PS06]|uniref:ABC transporter permease n=1 Tax=Bacillus sp. PS06 TaxID=2764176 RepID=UPI00177FE1B6|nr:FtsX-like permease family protein [Bacillus sp. PS06]MBD8070625.1 FtsX-like permease family protein [Bacillus sp. PS06]
MNIINKLTLRHLKENKKRTLVTIIGVIISVAMVTAVATLGESFLDLLKRQAIAMDGEWHVKYKNVNIDQIEAIEKDSQTKTLVLSTDRGYAELEGATLKDKPYIFVKEYNIQGLQQFPIEVSEGRLPMAKNEVVISEKIAQDTGNGYKIGDELTLDIGQRYAEGRSEPLGQSDSLQASSDGVIEELQIESTETFTIVGTIKQPEWEPVWSPGYTMINYIDKASLAPTDVVDAVVVLEKVNGSLYKHAEELAKQNNIEQVSYNSDLLRFYGVTNHDNLRVTLYSLLAIIMTIIIIGSVSLIYNAFAISVSERARHLGMLSSVGATKKQKRNSVFFEGAVIGVISIPLGILAGIGGITVTFMFLNTFIGDALGVSEKLQVVVTPVLVVVASLISIVTIFISTYLPARKASKISAIDAIRQTQDVKLSRKTVKTSKLVRRIFGIEAEIGLKNMKRNKRRYQATVFSLVISIILFLSVSYFTASLGKSVELSQDGINFDFSVTGDTEDIAKFEQLTQLDNITEYSIQKKTSLHTLIDEEDLPKEMYDNKESFSATDGKYEYYVNVYGLDEASFSAFATKIGADLEQFKDPEQPTAIVIDEISYYDYEASKFMVSESIKATEGDKLNLNLLDYETSETSPIAEIQIGALTAEVPIGVFSASIGGLDVIVPLETMNHFMGDKDDKYASASLYMNSDDTTVTQKALEELVPSNMNVFNVHQHRQQEQQIITIMSVFTYGFITLISLISIANIFNTISTSISLRKREFAMLKSVGMTPKGFNKMINYESIFYGVKALLYGLPISIAVMFLIYRSVSETFSYNFTLPWLNILFVIVAIFIIVSSAMLYSIGKIKNENIIDGLKQENI